MSPAGNTSVAREPPQCRGDLALLAPAPSSLGRARDRPGCGRRRLRRPRHRRRPVPARRVHGATSPARRPGARRVQRERSRRDRRSAVRVPRLRTLGTRGRPPLQPGQAARRPVCPRPRGRARVRPAHLRARRGRRPRGRPVRSGEHARLRRLRAALGGRRHPGPVQPRPVDEPAVGAVVAHRRLRGARSGADPPARQAAGRAARHLRGPCTPGCDRPPARAGHHRDRAAAHPRVRLGTTPGREGADQLLGLQHARVLRPARGLRHRGRPRGRAGGGAGRAAHGDPRAARGGPRGAARRGLQPHVRGRPARPAHLVARPGQRLLLRPQRRRAGLARRRDRHGQHARLPAGRGGAHDARLAAVLG